MGETANTVLMWWKFFGVAPFAYASIFIVLFMAGMGIIQTKTAIYYAVFVSLIFLGFCISTWLGVATRWTEDVQLSDGSVITIHRETTRVSRVPKTDRLYFKNPDEPSKEIEWHAIKTEDDRYPDRYPEKPLVLDKEAGVFIVFSYVGYRYVKYVYRNGTWVEEALPRCLPLFPERKTNLLIHDYKGMLAHITLPMKQIQNTVVTARDYSRVGQAYLRCP